MNQCKRWRYSCNDAGKFKPFQKQWSSDSIRVIPGFFLRAVTQPRGKLSNVDSTSFTFLPSSFITRPSQFTHTPLKSLLHFYEFFSREWRLSRLLSKIKGKRYPCVFFCKQSFRFFARAKLKILAGIRGASLVVSTAWFFVHGPRRQAGKQAGTHSLSQLQLRTAPDVLAMTVSFNDFLRHARSLARATRLARQKREFYPRIRD